MGDLSDFERGQIVGACLAEKSVIKTATLLGVSRATVSTVMSAYMTASAKMNRARIRVNTDRKQLSCIEKDCFEKSQKYCSTGELQQQYRGTVFYWSHDYPSWPNYCKGVRGQFG
jgi:hypothetical protein